MSCWIMSWMYRGCFCGARAYLKGNLVAANLAIIQQTNTKPNNTTYNNKHNTKQHDNKYDHTPTEQYLAEHITAQAMTT